MRVLMRGAYARLKTKPVDTLERQRLPIHTDQAGAVCSNGPLHCKAAKGLTAVCCWHKLFWCNSDVCGKAKSTYIRVDLDGTGYEILQQVQG